MEKINAEVVKRCDICQLQKVSKRKNTKIYDVTNSFVATFCNQDVGEEGLSGLGPNVSTLHNPW